MSLDSWFTVDPEANAAYLTVRPHALVDQQRQVGPGVVLDLDDDGNVVGMELLGSQDLRVVLGQILTVVRVP